MKQVKVFVESPPVNIYHEKVKLSVEHILKDFVDVVGVCGVWMRRRWEGLGEDLGLLSFVWPVEGGGRVCGEEAEMETEGN